MKIRVEYILLSSFILRLLIRLCGPCTSREPTEFTKHVLAKFTGVNTQLICLCLSVGGQSTLLSHLVNLRSALFSKSGALNRRTFEILSNLRACAFGFSGDSTLISLLFSPKQRRFGSARNIVLYRFLFNFVGSVAKVLDPGHESRFTVFQRSVELAVAWSVDFW